MKDFRRKEINVQESVFDELESSLLNNAAETHTLDGIRDMIKKLIGDIHPTGHRLSYSIAFYRNYMLEITLTQREGRSHTILKRLRVYRGFK